jgi:hypothetical protein
VFVSEEDKFESGKEVEDYVTALSELSKKIVLEKKDMEQPKQNKPVASTSKPQTTIKVETQTKPAEPVVMMEETKEKEQPPIQRPPTPTPPVIETETKDTSNFGNILDRIINDKWRKIDADAEQEKQQIKQQIINGISSLLENAANGVTTLHSDPEQIEILPPTQPTQLPTNNWSERRIQADLAELPSLQAKLSDPNYTDKLSILQRVREINGKPPYTLEELQAMGMASKPKLPQQVSPNSSKVVTKEKAESSKFKLLLAGLALIVISLVAFVLTLVALGVKI